MMQEGNRKLITPYNTNPFQESDAEDAQLDVTFGRMRLRMELNTVDMRAVHPKFWEEGVIVGTEDGPTNKNGL